MIIAIYSCHTSSVFLIYVRRIAVVELCYYLLQSKYLEKLRVMSTTSHIALNLQGKVAIVTGASRGIGAGLAIELARRGANVRDHRAIKLVLC